MHIHIYSKRITITEIRIFMHLYNKFTYIIILVTNLCLFRSLVYGTELILRATYTYSGLTLMVDLFLFRSPVGHIFILISRRTHTDIYLRRTHTYIDFLVYGTELIHILRRRYLSTYTYFYLSYTCSGFSQDTYLYLYKTYTYSDLPKDIYIGLILILVLNL